MPTFLNLRCDCHGTMILGQVEDGELVIRDRRHGEVHEVRVDLSDLMEEFRQVAHTRDTEAARQPLHKKGADPWPTKSVRSS